jgi:hypothetical protein
VADFYATFSVLTQYRLHAVITQGAQEIPNNRSIGNGWLYVEKLSGTGYFSNNSGNTGSISGDIFVPADGWAPYNFQSYTSRLIGSGSSWITHNSDGTRTASGSFQANDNNGGNMGSAGGGWALGLTTIPRGAFDLWNGSSWPMQMLDRFDQPTGTWKLQVLERWNGSAWVKEI